jgi:hypothetical protein
MVSNKPRKVYTILGPNGLPSSSWQPGVLGGNRKQKIYGRLDCPSALRAIKRGGPFGHYVKHRVFFHSEEDAIRAGYRPCHSCMLSEHQAWKDRGKR